MKIGNEIIDLLKENINFMIDYDEEKMILEECNKNIENLDIEKILDMKHGVYSNYIISDFTGYKRDIMEYCQSLIDKNSDMNLLENQCKILDAAIMQIGKIEDRMATL